MVDQITKQLEPRSIYLLLISSILLILLGSYFYVFKKGLSEFDTRQTQIEQFKDERVNDIGLDSDIEKIQMDISSLSQFLKHDSTNIDSNILESHIIETLDQIAGYHDIKLSSVKPGHKNEVLMFTELPFHIDVSGDYKNLYSWLQQVEQKLEPLIVKTFVIKGRADDIDIQDMSLTIVSYHYNG